MAEKYFELSYAGQSLGPWAVVNVNNEGPEPVEPPGPTDEAEFGGPVWGGAEYRAVTEGTVGDDFSNVGAIQFQPFTGFWTLEGDKTVGDYLYDYSDGLNITGNVTTPILEIGLNTLVSGSLTVTQALTPASTNVLIIASTGTVTLGNGAGGGADYWFSGRGGKLVFQGDLTGEQSIQVSDFQPGDIIDFPDEKGLTLSVNQNPTGTQTVDLYTGNTLLTQVVFYQSLNANVVQSDNAGGTELVVGSVPVNSPLPLTPATPSAPTPTLTTPASSGTHIPEPDYCGSQPTPLTTGQADLVDGLQTVPVIGPLLGAVALTFINGYQVGIDLVNLSAALANGRNTQPFYNQTFTDLGNVPPDVLGDAFLQYIPNLPSLPAASTNGIQAAVVDATRDLDSFLDAVMGAASSGMVALQTGQGIQGFVQGAEQSFLQSVRGGGITLPAGSSF
jgi:hypothetical protein